MLGTLFLIQFLYLWYNYNIIIIGNNWIYNNKNKVTTTSTGLWKLKLIIV